MKKDINISLIRFIAMIFIIVCHIFQYFSIGLAYWFNIGVQIFFFMSGYLYGKKGEIKNYKNWYIKQFKKIIIPMFILTIVMVICDKLILENSYSLKIVIANSLGIGVFEKTLNNLSHTWYVGYIVICYLLTPFFSKVNFKKDNIQIYRILILSIIILLFLQLFNVININAAWIFNYFMGYVFSAYFISNSKSKKQLTTILGIISVLMLMFTLAINFKLFGMFFGSEIITFFNDWCRVFCGSFLFIIMYDFFHKFKLKDNLILKFSDKYSYYIYLVHQIFILNSYSVLNITESLFLNILVMILVIIVAAILLKKIFDFVEFLITNLVFKRRKKYDT